LAVVNEDVGGFSFPAGECHCSLQMELRLIPLQYVIHHSLRNSTLHGLNCWLRRWVNHN